jgi:hypothetical protein
VSIALLGSLATNHAPGITAGLIAASILFAFVECVRAGHVPREAWLLLVPFGYWTLSFLLTRESWSVFLSMDFMRRDGGMLVSLLPMAAIASLSLDRRRMAAALLLYLAVQAAVAAVGGVGALTGWDSAVYRPAELVDHRRTFFGMYIAHNATSSVYVLLTLGAFAWALRPENTPKLRGILLALAGLLSMGCVLARSRGAFLALGVGLVFVLVMAIRRGLPRRVMIAGVVGLSVAVLAGGIIVLPRFLKMFEKGADKDRRETWSQAMSDFKRSPVVGVGFGRYNDVQREFESIGIGEVVTKARVYNDDRHAHNSYLHWLAEGGALGLAVMIVFWILVARGLKGDDALRDWILAGIVGMAALSLTEHYAGGGAFLVHLAFLVGVRQSRIP